MSMRVTAVIQARMGSTRLPGKVLKPLGDSDVLSWVLARVGRARLVNDIWVATSTNSRDDVLADRIARLPSIGLIRGPEEDVLARYALALDISSAQYFVRVTADCPLIDPDVMDDVIHLAMEDGSRCDYASNTVERTYPRGLDVEVFSRRALAEASQQASEPAEKEHVTPFIWKQPERFGVRQLLHPTDLSDHRWTLDTVEDYRLLQRVCAELGPEGQQANLSSILDVFSREPGLMGINSGVNQKGT
jgi:spore coat polysaccharide biosynthesis protein SpsF